jgi:hypothetical protein
MEWALLAVIAVLCAVLSFLQYRWTGELSKAEPALLRAGLNDQLRRLAQEFNNDIRENSTALVPDLRAVGENGAVEALRNRYTQWASSHDGNLFLRIGLAAPEKGELKLYGIDRAGRIDPMAWPAEWEDLRAPMAARLKGFGRPPSTGPDSNLIQVPLFAPPGPELGWVLFELNEDYIRSKMLPQLVAEYLNPLGLANDAPVYDVSVSREAPDGGDFLHAQRPYERSRGR